MSVGEIVVNVVNGRRAPFDPSVTRLLVTATDGRQRNVAKQFVNGNRIALSSLTVRDNLDDRYTVLVSAKDHTDAGFTPVTVKATESVSLDLMMVRREADFVFQPFERLAPHTDLVAFLRGENGDGSSLYGDLRVNKRAALACLLNITTALEQMKLAPLEGLTQTPSASIKALAEPPEQDRVFAWADVRLLEQMRATVDKKGAGGLTRVAGAPKGLHEGATASFKQIDFGEGNVQFSFHEGRTHVVAGVPCMVVELDIDYFKDAAAHILLEVFQNKLKSRLNGKDSAESLTDPKAVYGLRWIAGKRAGLDFNPPYVLQ
jgi:hypothetical protein